MRSEQGSVKSVSAGKLKVQRQKISRMGNVNHRRRERTRLETLALLHHIHHPSLPSSHW